MYRNARVSARTERRRVIEREAHGAVLQLHTNGVPQAHADWHYDLRRGRLCIYGGLLRFIDCAIAAGKPGVARLVVQWLHWYVEDQINPTDTGEMKAIAA